jgi:hypothetical protein
LSNGSFEETYVAPNTWAHFSPEQIPGWKSLFSERIELWGKDFSGVSAPHGQNILELDYHHSDKLDAIYQDISTNKGQAYEASFFIRARRGELFQTADETVVFSWNGKESAYTAHKADVWTKISIIVLGTGGYGAGTGGRDRLTLRESSDNAANNSLGPLLDDVRLVPAKCSGETRSGEKPSSVR